MTSLHSSSSSSDRSSCPCQRIPLSLSSATSAEYGNIASLARRVKSGAAAAAAVAAASSITRSNPNGGGGAVSGGKSSSIPGGISNGGITPLHLAAQHGHPAAVSLLLTEGSCDVDTGLPANYNADATAGATPLHRAAFSGAIFSMQILLSWGEENDGESRRTNLLAKDVSFGDKKTPLHKAISGGRPLAVQLLINALRQRFLLLEALHMKDASGLTPLQLAKQFTSMNTEELDQERQSVRRWDVVAGGNSANWDNCLRLIEGATPTIRASSDNTFLPEKKVTQQSKPYQKALPAMAEFDNATRIYCEDINECQDGQCRTAIWENAFRMALTSSMDMSLNNHAKSTKITVMAANGDDNGRCLPCPSTPKTLPIPVTDTTAAKKVKPSLTQKATATKMGRQCDSCGKHSAALFRSANHQLVCKKCRRLCRR